MGIRSPNQRLQFDRDITVNPRIALKETDGLARTCRDERPFSTREMSPTPKTESSGHKKVTYVSRDS